MKVLTNKPTLMAPSTQASEVSTALRATIAPVPANFVAPLTDNAKVTGKSAPQVVAIAPAPVNYVEKVTPPRKTDEVKSVVEPTASSEVTIAPAPVKFATSNDTPSSDPSPVLPVKPAGPSTQYDPPPVTTTSAIAPAPVVYVRKQVSPPTKKAYVPPPPPDAGNSGVDGDHGADPGPPPPEDVGPTTEARLPATIAPVANNVVPITPMSSKKKWLLALGAVATVGAGVYIIRKRNKGATHA